MTEAWGSVVSVLEDVVAVLVALAGAPLVTITFLLILAISYDLPPLRGLGAGGLFWHANRVKQFFIGACSGLALTELVFLVYLPPSGSEALDRAFDWSPSLLVLDSGSGPDDIGRYLTAALAVVCAVVALPALRSPLQRWPLPAGLVVAVGAVALSTWCAAKVGVLPPLPEAPRLEEVRTEAGGKQDPAPQAQPQAQPPREVTAGKEAVAPPKAVAGLKGRAKQSLERQSKTAPPTPAPKPPPPAPAPRTQEQLTAEYNKQLDAYADAVAWRTIVLKCCLGVSLALALATLALLSLGGVRTPMMSLMIFLAIFHAFDRYLLNLADQGAYVLVWVALIGAGLLLNRSPRKMQWPALESYYPNPVPLPVTPDLGNEAPAASVGPAADPNVGNPTGSAGGKGLCSEELIRTARRQTPEDRVPPLIVITTAGGGVRAAVWTCAVLEALERRLPTVFPRLVRVITGASGMLGAGYYVAHKAKSPGPAGAAVGQLAREIGRDALTPIVRQMLFNDLPRVWWPFRNLRDRGRALEQAWLENTTPPGGTSPLDMTFSGLRDEEKQGQIPSLVFSPMLVEDARRLLISNLDLSTITSVTLPSRLKGVDALTAFELFGLFPEAHATFKLCTAARMNASFPFFSPAVYLPTQPLRRVVDAGYYDNYGVDVAAEWVYRYQEALRQHTSRVLFLQLRAYPIEKEKAGQTMDPVRRGVAAGLEWLSSPLSAVLSMRARSPWYRNDERLRGLSSRFDANFFRIDHLEFGDDGIPLSWFITEAQAEAIINQATSKVDILLKDLEGWLTEPLTGALAPAQGS